MPRNRGSVPAAAEKDLDRLTSPDVLLAAQGEMAAEWRRSTLPEFRTLLDAEPYDQPEPMAGE